MQYLWQHLAAAPHGGQTPDAFVQFLFGDRTRPATDYRQTQATWFHSPGDEHLYRRSSWQPDAVWASMAGGSTIWAGHQMRAAGHVAIQRGNDYLLVNSGQWKGPTGDFGTPQAFDLRSWRGNTLFVDDGGDYLFTGTDYVGGQGSWGATSVLASDGGADFAYMKADLTTAYGIGDYKPWDSRSVRYFLRNFLSMGNGVVVVFDRMQFRSPSYVKKLYFHLNPGGGPPAIAGNTASIRVGGSALFVRSLLPAAPILAAAPDPVSDSDSQTITYRLEVSDSAASTNFNALNVFVAGPASTTSMPTTTRVQSTSGAMVGAVVADGAVQRIGLFSADGTSQSDISYSVTAFPAGQTSTHVLADLVPNAQYSVTRDGTSVGNFTASSQGVLTFTSAQGGTFAVRSQALPKAPTNVRILGGAGTPSVAGFSATPSTLPAGGGTVMLAWQVNEADALTIDNGIGAVGGSGTRQIAVTKTTVFTLTATNASGSTTASTTVVVGANPASDGSRFVAIVAPVGGERFSAPSALRLVAVGRDPGVETNYPSNGLGGNADRVQFFVDDTMVLDVAGSDAEFFVFKGFISNVAAGQRRVWARAFYRNPTVVLDSPPVLISVNAPPAYTKTIDLATDLSVVGDYELAGSSAGRIRVNGNGHRILSGAGGSRTVTLRHVDFVDVGDRTATDVPGIDLTVSGALTFEDCTFDNSNSVRIVANGAASAAIRSSTFRSNMRQPLGQYPDAYGGTRHGSYPALILSGMSAPLKSFQANNVAAGWVALELTRNWLVGGDAASDGNVLIGPRVGIFVDRSTNVQLRKNYSHHVYFGGWSQGSNFELGGDASVTAEQNVIIGSSWPVRGVGGEFRYNLVLEAGHEWLWADHDEAFVHHNVFAGGDNDVGGIYVLYGVRNVRVENNTFDGFDVPGAATAINVADGAASVRSNLFYRLPHSPITVADGASVSADYNLAWACGSPTYSDGRTPIHDVSADPRLVGPVPTVSALDEARLWARDVTVSDVLAQYRASYSPSPGSPALGAADPARGPQAFIGAIGSATGSEDRFGR
jgi:hypothetical protein